MRALVFLLFGALACGQNANQSLSNLAKNEQPSENSASATTSASSVAPDAPVLSIKGLCDDTAPGTAQPSDCTTAITRVQFESLVQFIQPEWSIAQRKQFAASYAEALVLAAQARRMGLDSGPRFETLMKMQKEFVLQYLLAQALQEKAAQVPDQEIGQYYKENSKSFEQMEYQRLYVPITQQLMEAGLSATEARKRREVSMIFMKKTADDLRSRAVKGEDLERLQEEAYKAAGYGSTGNWPKLDIQKRRQNGLPSGESSLVDLTPGELSPVFDESNGHYICKMISKRTLTLPEVRSEITERLRTDRLHEFQREAHQSATSTLNESYFTVDPSNHIMSEP